MVLVTGDWRGNIWSSPANDVGGWCLRAVEEHDAWIDCVCCSGMRIGCLCAACGWDWERLDACRELEKLDNRWWSAKHRVEEAEMQLWIEQRRERRRRRRQERTRLTRTLYAIASLMA